MSETVLHEQRWRLLLYGAVIGLVYGLSIRAGFALPLHLGLQLMSISFLFLVPFAMGFVTVYLVECRQPQPIGMWFLLPVFPVVGGLIASLAALWEGLICVLMFAPIGIGLGVIGGFLGGLIARRLHSPRLGNLPMVCVAVLPLLVSPWEQQVFADREIRTVESSIDVRSTPEAVWENIKRVPEIHPAELPASWSHRIGFPNPVEATLSHEGVDGVRHATFEGGVLFIEHVDIWEPNRRLAFSIHAQAAQIPPTTLDEHVTVGGPFFDVLRGEYLLEQRPNGVIRLHLSSQQRVSTDFNWYAHLWTDAVMKDLQDRILYVVRNRAEEAARAAK